MQKTAAKIDMDYWNGLKTPPAPMDTEAINAAFHSQRFTDSQKADMAQLILASRMRVLEEDRAAELDKAISLFNRDFAVEEFFYTESTQLFCTWRYDYSTYVQALPLQWVKPAVRNIYAQLGVDIDDEDVEKICSSKNIYSAFFGLISDTLQDSRYFVPDDKKNWNSFAFVSYFNMWHIFGPLAFGGYSPYTLCADIGLLTPRASSWRSAAFTEDELYCIEELRSRGRGRRWPTWQQNRFMGQLGRI